MKAFHKPVLRYGLPWLDIDGLDLVLLEPSLHDLGDKL